MSRAALDVDGRETGRPGFGWRDGRRGAVQLAGFGITLAFAAALALPAAAHHGEPGSHAKGSQAVASLQDRAASERSTLSAPRESIVARLVRIDDGDSFVARAADGETIRVRLAGIDAPEKSQPWADIARRRLRALLDGHSLMISPLKNDRWGRFVALVEVAGEDVSLAMLESGLAWHFARFDGDLPPTLRLRYADAAAAAREERAGLWRGEDPVPPWQFRQRADGPQRVARPQSSR